MDATHVILTRFNLATPGREFAIRTQPGWLDGRFDLFRTWCLPAMGAQTDARFRWLVFFDEGTPAPHRAEIERLRREVPFEPVFTGLFASAGWGRAVREVVAPTTEWLLTTRLDSDDALACDFVERLRGAARPEAAAWNFRHGLIRADDALYAVRHPNNAFFSLSERMDGAIRTASDIQHMRLFEEGPVRQIDGAPAWLQLVHGGNVSNRVRGRRIAADGAGARFGGRGLEGVVAPSAGAQALDRLALGPVRGLRDAASAGAQALRARLRL